MRKSVSHILLLIVCFTAGVRCHSIPEKSVIRYESLDAANLSDSLSAHRPAYREDLSAWKTVYADCLHDSLFTNAFYLGLQTSLWIGGISNREVQNINKQITVLDTSANGNILNILAVNKSGNCFAKINLTKSLQDGFYNELVGNLKKAGDCAYLATLIDSSQIIFRISTMIDYSIRPDSLLGLLDRTSDSSLIYFRQILTTPGNALLVRAGMIFGFNSEFHLNRKLTGSEEEKFKTEVYFNLGTHGEKGSIKLLSNQNLQVNITKNYTIFGQFEVFK